MCVICHNSSGEGGRLVKQQSPVPLTFHYPGFTGSANVITHLASDQWITTLHLHSHCLIKSAFAFNTARGEFTWKIGGVGGNLYLISTTAFVQGVCGWKKRLDLWLKISQNCIFINGTFWLKITIMYDKDHSLYHNKILCFSCLKKTSGACCFNYAKMKWMVARLCHAVARVF